MRIFLYTCLVPVLLLLLYPVGAKAQQQIPQVNDISRLNCIDVLEMIAPTTTEEIVEAVRSHNGPVSIGGGRYSMGGQIGTEQSLHIDMRQFDSVLHFSAAGKEITVQAGITWRQVQEFIDPYDLSVKIMQTYANFTVGGSLSVNVHGRYVGQGPLILSVKQVKMVLADGTVVTASPEQHRDLFYGAIGGYGGLGVITEATLSLADNCKVQRIDKLMKISEYSSYFHHSVLHDSSVIFHNANMYPLRYKKVRAVSYATTNKAVTIPHRLKPSDQKYGFNRFAFKMIADIPGGKWMRQHLLEPLIYIGRPVEWRNYEASYNVSELEPRSREKSTYVLQEYFVPVQHFDTFYPLLVSILRQRKVNVINISIRHARKDPGSMLAWAKEDVFAFVIYYKQGTSATQQEEVAGWTRELITAVLLHQGTYYLPYQLHATPDQFMQAYPGAPAFFALKKQVDPSNKFRNKLWDKYFRQD